MKLNPKKVTSSIKGLFILLIIVIIATNIYIWQNYFYFAIPKFRYATLNVYKILGYSLTNNKEYSYDVFKNFNKLIWPNFLDQILMSFLGIIILSIIFCSSYFITNNIKPKFVMRNRIPIQAQITDHLKKLLENYLPNKEVSFLANNDNKINAHVFSYNGKNNILISLGLLYVLGKDQKIFNTYILHEIGHIRNNDIIMRNIVKSLYNSWIILNTIVVIIVILMNISNLLSIIFILLKIVLIFISVYIIYCQFVSKCEFYADFDVFNTSNHKNDILVWLKADISKKKDFFHPSIKNRINYLKNPNLFFKINYSILTSIGYLLIISIEMLNHTSYIVAVKMKLLLELKYLPNFNMWNTLIVAFLFLLLLVSIIYKNELFKLFETNKIQKLDSSFVFLSLGIIIGKITSSLDIYNNISISRYILWCFFVVLMIYLILKWIRNLIIQTIKYLMIKNKFYIIILIISLTSSLIIAKFYSIFEIILVEDSIISTTNLIIITLKHFIGLSGFYLNTFLVFIIWVTPIIFYKLYPCKLVKFKDDFFLDAEEKYVELIYKHINNKQLFIKQLFYSSIAFTLTVIIIYILNNLNIFITSSLTRFYNILYSSIIIEIFACISVLIKKKTMDIIYFVQYIFLFSGINIFILTFIMLIRKGVKIENLDGMNKLFCVFVNNSFAIVIPIVFLVSIFIKKKASVKLKIYNDKNKQ